MNFDYELFTQASTLVHLLQGLGLLLLAAAEAWAARRPGARTDLPGGALLGLCALAAFAAMVALPGGGSLRGLSEAFAERGGFRIFVAFCSLYGAAGACLAAAAGRERSLWRAAFVLQLAAAGALYFIFPSRLAEEARAAAQLPHAAAGAALLAAAAAAAAAWYTGRRGARAVLAALLFAAALPLLAYREHPASFGPRRVSVEVPNN